MLTGVELSNIWYGSKEFLKLKLDELLDNNVISFYAFIKHLPEEDEKKVHYHLFFTPERKVDTVQLSNLFTEIDLTNPLPIKMLRWDKSKFGDWYLYNSHNIAYLASKGQKRKYHYNFNDFISNSTEMLNELVHTIDMSKINRIETVRRAAENGIAFSQLVRDGQIPVQLINQYQKAYEMCLSAYASEYETLRNGYKNHEIDEESEEDLPF